MRPSLGKERKASEEGRKRGTNELHAHFKIWATGSVSDVPVLLPCEHGSQVERMMDTAPWGHSAVQRYLTCFHMSTNSSGCKGHDRVIFFTFRFVDKPGQHLLCNTCHQLRSAQFEWENWIILSDDTTVWAHFIIVWFVLGPGGQWGQWVTVRDS